MPFFATWAAVRIIVIMASATGCHAVRAEYSSAVITFILLPTAAFLADDRQRIRPIRARGSARQPRAAPPVRARGAGPDNVQSAHAAAVHLMTRWLAAAALLGLLLTTACAARSTAPSLADVETAVRVKTALVNDSVLGIEDVRIEVRQAVAHLTGRISAAGREPEIVALVRTVPGITGVTANFTVAPHVGAVQSRLGVLPERMRERRGRLIAVGAGVRVARAAGPDVDDGLNVAPFVRLGSADGFGPAIGFGWNRRDLLASPTGDPALASLRVRPVMGGVAYTRTLASRYQVSGSLVGGYAFTHLSVDRRAAGPWRAIDVENTFAWRPSATLWIDPGGRLSYQVSAGYLVARPRVTYASDTGVTAARVRGDALMVTVGAAWWVF